MSMKNPERRVVVTGVGLVSPVGVGTDITWKALLAGESGIAPITLFDATGFSCRIAGEVKGFVAEDFIERKEIKKMGRFIQFAMAASAGAWGSFLHQGQICMTTGRHIVADAIYDDYVGALAEKAGHLPVGDPASGQVALGPIIDERQREKIHTLVTSTVEAGARLAAGGTYDGLFYAPTVLDDVTMKVRAGTVHALVGENGAGKSTMLGIFAGRLAHTRDDPWRAGARILRRILYSGAGAGDRRFRRDPARASRSGD